MVTVLASSRASPFPQGFCFVDKMVGTPKITVGASLLAMAVYQAPLSH
jgi:hypothetical protein